MLDVTIAAALLAIAITSLMSLIFSSLQLSRVDRETTIAHQAMRRATEEMQMVVFEGAFANFSANPNFAVRGLTPQVGDAEIRAAIEELVAAESLTGPQAMGPVMKAMVARFAGNADGGTISRIAREVLS